MSWKKVKLGSLCHTVTKGTTPTSVGLDFSFDGIPFLRIQNLANHSVSLDDVLYISKETHENLKRSIIHPRDFLITIAGTIGRVAIVPESFPECNCNQAIAILRFDQSKLLSSYLLYWINTKDALTQISGKSVTATISNLSLGQIKDLEITLPPLAEQKRIAAILDKADAIRRKRQQAIQLADDFLRSVFLDMFGDPVTNAKGWEVTEVGAVTDCIVPGRDKPKSFTGSTPWVTTSDIDHLGYTICLNGGLALSQEEITQVKAKVVPSGSVIMTCVGDLGVVTINQQDIVINQQLHAFQCHEDSIKNVFLMYTLSFLKAYMVKMASNTTVPYLNKTMCNSVPIILPPLDLQTKFQKIFNFHTDLKKLNILLVKSSQNMFNSLSQKAFSGQL